MHKGKRLFTYEQGQPKSAEKLVFEKEKVKIIKVERP